jgi:hypothetical protein
MFPATWFPGDVFTAGIAYYHLPWHSFDYFADYCYRTGDGLFYLIDNPTVCGE